MSLRGTRTEANLRAALTLEAEANRRYLWFAEQAEIEGHPEVAALFRRLAEGETGHAFGHLEYLAEVGDAETGQPLETTEDHLRAALAAERRDAAEVYPSFAATAREEGFDEIGGWLEQLAGAEAKQAELLAAELASLVGTEDGDREERT